MGEVLRFLNRLGWFEVWALDFTPMQGVVVDRRRVGGERRGRVVSGSGVVQGPGHDGTMGWSMGMRDGGEGLVRQTRASSVLRISRRIV
jgi:hypothetical protein